MLLSFLFGSVLVAGATSMSCHNEVFSYYPDSDKCLTFVENMMAFAAADTNCKVLGGQLVTPRSAEAEVDLSNTFDGLYNNIWLGILDPTPSKNFLYVDSQTPVSGYTNWYVPIADQSGTHSCAISGTYENVRRWIPVACTDSARSVCEAEPVVPTCNTNKGWVKMQTDKCFKVYKGHRRFDYDKAQSYCESLGGDLATDLVSYQHRKDIGKLMRFNGNFWIGFHDQNADGSYTDINGDPMSGADSAFKKRLPRAGRCISFKRRWFYAKNCHRRLRVICQKAAA